MRRIMVLNPKGGSGKTTLATNLASYYASQGLCTALMDFDGQGSATYWGSRRPDTAAPIQVIAAWRQAAGVTRSWALRVQAETRRVVIDSPAGLDLTAYQRTLHEADAILIPVLPSEVDIHAASRCVADLLLVAKLSRQDERLAVVANRARRHTRVYGKLELFLRSLNIPFVATLRDTQHYVRAFEQGLGIFELPGRRVADDRDSWRGLLDWVESRPPLTRNQRRAG